MEPSERFSLKVPPTIGPRTIAALAVGLGLMAALSGRLPTTREGALLLLALAAAAILPGALALLAASTQPRRRVSIEVLPDRVHLPTEGPARLAVRYRDITALILQRRGLGGFLYISTPERELVFPLRAFPADEAERLFEAIRSRIARGGPDGERRLAALEQIGRVADRAFARVPVVTWATVLVMACVHVYLLATGQISGELDVASLGGVSPELVEAAGPYLALTAHFVHGWPFQPLLVLPALFVVGSLVERLLGHGAAALAIFGSAVLGGVAAAVFPGAPLHAGGLVPVAGLAGTLAFSAQLYRGRMPIGFKLNGQWWAWMAALVALAAQVHGISVPAIGGGVLAGALVAAGLLGKEPELPLVSSPRWAGALAALLILLHAGAAAWAVADLRGRGLELERVAVRSSLNARSLKSYAWQIAAHEPHPSRERLELALEASQRALRLESGAFERVFRDTRATVLHRLGRHREAIEAEEAILDEHPALEHPALVEHATQLARFLASRLEAEGPLGAEGAPLDGVRVELERPVPDAVDPKGSRPEVPASLKATVYVERPPTTPHVLYAIVGAKGGLGALLRVPLAAGARTATVAVAPVSSPLWALPEALGEVRPAWSFAGRTSGKVWALNRELLELP